MVSVERESIQCPVCDSPRNSLHLEPWVEESDPYKLFGSANGVRGSQRLVRCDECDLIYENPRHSEEAILSAYANASGAKHSDQHDNRVTTFYRALKSLHRFLPKAGALLDVGTASGACVEAASKLGYDAYGLEPSRELVQMAQSRGLQVVEGTIDSHPYDDKTFDVVCLWDVLEHVCRPRDMFNSIHSLLSEDGVLVVNFPVIDGWVGKVVGKHMWWIQSVHIQHFSRSSMRTLADLTEFEICTFRQFSQTLSFAHLLKMAQSLFFPKLRFGTESRLLNSIPIRYWAAQTTVVMRKKKP